MPNLFKYRPQSHHKLVTFGFAWFKTGFAQPEKVLPTSVKLTGYPSNVCTTMAPTGMHLIRVHHVESSVQ